MAQKKVEKKTRKDEKDYQSLVQKRLDELTPIFAKAAIGDFSSSPELPDSDDIFSELFTGVGILLSAVRTTIEELEDRNRKILEGKKLDEAILESIGDGMIATDRSGRINVSSNSAAQMIGVSKEDLCGAEIHDILSIRNENNKEITRDSEPLFRTLNLREIVSAKNFVFVRRDGRKFPVALITTPVVVNDKLFGAIMIFRDITKELEIDRAKTEFVSLVSHQLRTPLSILRWYGTELITDEVKNVSPEVKKIANVIYDTSLRMIELVDTFLNVSRIDLGTFIFEPKEFDASVVANDVIRDLSLQIRQKQAAIKRIYTESLLVKWDAKLLQIILMNLLSNAIRYSPQDAEVEISMGMNGNNFDIAVKDFGCGIPNAEQHKIFSKLFRARNASLHSPNGTGLGLYIVKSILEHTGGDIRFESEENKGTTFYVTIFQ